MADDQNARGNVESPGSDDVDNAPAAPACAMVIFGAGGDLTKRLVAPALYNLSRAKRLADGFRIVGVDLANQSVDDWRRKLTDMMKEFVRGGDAKDAELDQPAWRFLTDRMSYLQGDLTDPATYRRLGNISLSRSTALKPRAITYSISRSRTASSPLWLTAWAPRA